MKKYNKKQKKIYYQKNKKRILQQRRLYIIKNKIKIKTYYKKWCENNKEYISLENKKYYEKNKNSLKRKAKIYYLKHKKHITLRKRIYNLEKRQKDDNFRLIGNLRSRICMAVKHYKKSTTTKDLTSCSLKFLKRHLEKQFTFKMNWNNYGKYWEIDHIKPCFKFDLSKESEQRKCFNYHNLRPLTIKQNRARLSNV